MENIAEKLTLYLEKKDIIKDERNVYKYGFEGLISTLVGTFLLIIIGIITNHLIEAIIYECIFSTLRKYIGGYHCKSHAHCIVLYNSLFMLFIIIETYLKLNSLAILGCMILIITYAPIKNKNKSISTSSEKHNRVCGIIWSLVVVMSIVIMYLNNIHYYKILFYIIYLTTILMIGGKIEYERNVL